jgi:Protein of unknown function (DUF3105)
MAQRKSPSGGKPAAKKGTSRPAGKPASGSSAKLTPTRGSNARKPGKSIVHQKQTPWGLIATIAAVVVFAAVVVGVVVATSGGSGGKAKSECSGANKAYCQPEVAAAKQIQGVIHKIEPKHDHVTTTVKYDTTPPTGGNHSGYWADCNGTVYAQPIASENAVHGLEHGAVWITYRQGLPAGDVAKLAQDVTGQKFVFMSPYPNLKTKVSLQAWGYQLFVNDVTDPRITEFLALKQNPKITPEAGASCDQPTFKAHPSTFGHPLFAPASGSGGSTMSS